MKLKLEVEEPYDLDLTLSPSFVSSMYVKLKPGSWVKIAGTMANKLKLVRKRRGEVEVSYDSSLNRSFIEEAASFEAGLWHKPFEFKLNTLPSCCKPIVDALSLIYRGVRLPIAPWDFLQLFIATVLSRRTSYKRFVVKWCRAFWSLFKDPLSIARASLNDIGKVGTSYQLIQLQASIQDLASLPERLGRLCVGLDSIPKVKDVQEITSLPPELVRVLLLRACRYVGPKTVDSLILSSFKAPHFAPCDVHFRNIVMKLKLAKSNLVFPEKRFCSRFSCIIQPFENLEKCLNQSRCLRASLSWLKDLGGWIQTLCYLHGSSICRTRNPKCSMCSLIKFCRPIG